MRRMGMLALGLAGWGVAGCGSDVPGEDPGPDLATCALYGVDKALFTGPDLVGAADPPTFTMEVEVLGTDFEGAEPPVFEGSTMTVRFEILQDYLVARRTADDVPVGAYEIERHVPVVCRPPPRCILISELHVIPPPECHDFHAAVVWGQTSWDARPRFAFDPSKNLVASELAFDGESQRWPAEASYQEVGYLVAEGELAPRVEPDSFWHADQVYAEIPLEPNACLPKDPGPDCLTGTILLGISYSRR